jgi:hypothetical protein
VASCFLNSVAGLGSPPGSPGLSRALAGRRSTVERAIRRLDRPARFSDHHAGRGDRGMPDGIARRRCERLRPRGRPFRASSHDASASRSRRGAPGTRSGATVKRRSRPRVPAGIGGGGLGGTEVGAAG